MSIVIPKKVSERLTKTSRKYNRILDKALKSDINESDTVLIVRDMLEEIFGFDRYEEITTEYAIRNIYCDVAIKIKEKPLHMIEVKAIGSDLKENHLRQAKEYSSETGLDWVILTNARIWKVYKLIYKQPVKLEPVFEVDWLTETMKDNGFIEKVFCLCKEGISKTALTQYREEKQATDRHILGAVMLGEPVLKAIRKEIKKIFAFNVPMEELHEAIREDVLKREVVEGDEAKAAIRKYKSSLSKIEKQKPSE